MIELSKFYSDDERRVATVYTSTDGDGYFVKCKNDSGSTFRADFKSLDLAEDFADDWIRKVIKNDRNTTDCY